MGLREGLEYRGGSKAGLIGEVCLKGELGRIGELGRRGELARIGDECLVAEKALGEVAGLRGLVFRLSSNLRL